MTGQKYQHVPVVVEAMTLSKENAEEIAIWCGGDVIQEQNPVDPNDVYVGINYPTSDGNKRLSQGETIVRTDRGKFEKMNTAHFNNFFEPVPEKPAAVVLPHTAVPGARKV